MGAPTSVPESSHSSLCSPLASQICPNIPQLESLLAGYEGNIPRDPGADKDSKEYIEIGGTKFSKEKLQHKSFQKK